jgi:Mg-chelatase subunit ChlD
MSALDALSWWQWAVLAALPPAIVLLYFLKLRRKPIVVPSTYLWHKSVEDMRANSLWQRLRANLLLLLQLLLIGIVMLALARPSWSGGKLVGHRFILLVDTSASMSASDASPTRLDEAKRRAAAIIDEIAAGDVAMIVSFSDVARVEQVFTDNRRQLERRLAAIGPTNRTTSLAEALRVAAGLANRSQTAELAGERSGEDQPATVYIFSDGRFADVERFSMGSLTPVFVPIGRAESANVGITSFGVRRLRQPSQTLQAFARLENSAAHDTTTDVELYRDDSLVDNKKVEIKARGSGGVSFDLGDLQTGLLKAVVRRGGALAIDDRAWAVVDPPLRSNVLLVTPGNDALRSALNTDRARALADVETATPEILATEDYRDKAAAGYYAVVIYDQCRPQRMPEADTLFIGALPPSDAWSAKATVAAPAIIDLESSHPLMQLIDLGDVRFAEASPLVPPPGATVLVSTDAGPLLAIAPREGFEDAVLGAEIVGRDAEGQVHVNSDWPLRLSFPVFVLNMLGYFTDAAAAGSPSIQPGHAAPLGSYGSAQELRIRSPSGKSTVLSRGRGESFHFSGTDEPGVYKVEVTGQRPSHFSVNLCDSQESDILPRGGIRIGYEDVQGEAGWEGARREFWKPLLLAALAVLLGEWYIYSRRVFL